MDTKEVRTRDLTGKRTTIAFPGSFTLRDFPEGDYDALFLFLGEHFSWLQGARATISDQLGRSLDLALTGREPIYLGRNGGQTIEVAVSLQVFPEMREGNRSLPSVANLLALSEKDKRDLAARIYDAGFHLPIDYALRVI